MAEAKVVVSGAGAAGTACAKMLVAAGVRNLIGNDIHCIIHRDRTEPGIQWWIENTNSGNRRGTLGDVIAGADLFLSVSTGGMLTGAMVQRMARDPIIFAHAIAACITDAELSADNIIPSVFNRRVAPAVAVAVEEAAHRSGVARRGSLEPLGSPSISSHTGRGNT